MERLGQAGKRRACDMDLDVRAASTSERGDALTAAPLMMMDGRGATRHSRRGFGEPLVEHGREQHRTATTIAAANVAAAAETADALTRSILAAATQSLSSNGQRRLHPNPAVSRVDGRVITFSPTGARPLVVAKHVDTYSDLDTSSGELADIEDNGRHTRHASSQPPVQRLSLAIATPTTTASFTEPTPSPRIRRIVSFAALDRVADTVHYFHHDSPPMPRKKRRQLAAAAAAFETGRMLTTSGRRASSAGELTTIPEGTRIAGEDPLPEHASQRHSSRAAHRTIRPQSSIRIYRHGNAGGSGAGSHHHHIPHHLQHHTTAPRQHPGFVATGLERIIQEMATLSTRELSAASGASTSLSTFAQSAMPSNDDSMQQ